MHMSIKLKEIPTTERPRERLSRHGVSSLSNTELLSLVLRSGGPSTNVLSLSTELLTEFGSLQELFSADTAELKKIKYMGDTKISAIKAIGELAKRSISTENLARHRILTPQDVFNLIRPHILGKKKEHLYVISLGLNAELLKLSLLSVGTLNETLVDTREVLRTALIKGAVSFILAHNHPSDSLEPSMADVYVTREVAGAAVYVGLDFVDHVIVNSSDYYSFRLSGVLSSSKGGENFGKN